VSGHARLQVQGAERALPGVQVGEPGPQVLERVAPATGRRRELGPDVAVQEPHADRRPPYAAHPAEVRAGLLELTASDPDPRDVDPGQRGLPLQALPGELAGEPFPTTGESRPGAAGLDLGGEESGVGAHLPRPGSGAPEAPQRVAGGRPGGIGVAEHQAARQRELRLAAALVEPPPTVGVRGGRQRGRALLVQPRRHQHLGTVLLDHRGHHRTFGGHGRVRDVEVAQRCRQVTTQEVRVAQVVQCLGRAVLVAGLAVRHERALEVGAGRGELAALQVHVAPVEVHPGDPLRVVEAAEGLVELVHRGRGLAPEHVDQTELRVQDPPVALQDVVVAEDLLAQVHRGVVLTGLREHVGEAGRDPRPEVRPRLAVTLGARSGEHQEAAGLPVAPTVSSVDAPGVQVLG